MITINFRIEVVYFNLYLIHPLRQIASKALNVFQNYAERDSLVSHRKHSLSRVLQGASDMKTFILSKMKKADRIALFVRSVHSWNARHKRVLPWRDLKDDHPDILAYKVLVSEVMLQQTQVPRVIFKYKEFVQKFPQLQALSEASNAEILIAWRGMGYNSRALRLRDAARAILTRAPRRMSPGARQALNVENGFYFFPVTMKEFLTIKGIGPYTAAAIRNFAFGLATAMIDTNIRRVLHRTFFGPENADGTWPVNDQILLDLCHEVLCEWMRQGHSCSDLFSALMDFGSLVQTKRNPKWEVCPLTAEGIMKTTKKSYERLAMSYKKDSKLIAQSSKLREPGRIIAGRFVPNRIIRGRIVELLRDHPKGLPEAEIGRHVAIDWNAREHKVWLQNIVAKLLKEQILLQKKEKISLF